MVAEQPLDTPPSQAEVPAGVVAIAAGRPIRSLWVNEAGGRAFLVGAETGPAPGRASAS